MKVVFLRLLSGLLLAGILAALFFPYFETFTYDEPLAGNRFTVAGIRPNPHQGGHFGGGFFILYRGFGSIHAWFNAGLSVLLFLLLLIPLNRDALRAFLLLFIGSHLLVYLGMCSAPFLLSPSDTLHGGYYLMTACEIGLFAVAYQIVARAAD